jgi:AraC-like DNA-binding protein
MNIAKTHLAPIVFLILHIFAQNGLLAQKWDEYFNFDKFISTDEQFLSLQKKLKSVHSDREKLDLLNFWNYPGSRIPIEKNITYPQMANELHFRKLYDETREKIHSTRVTAAILAISQKYEKDKWIAEITRMKKNKIKIIWLNGLLILTLVLLLGFLIFNIKRIKKMSRKLLALKDVQIAEQQTQLRMLRAKLVEMAKAGKDDKYLNSHLSDDQAQDISKKLIRLMEKEKPYLDCDMSLASLAGQLDVNSSYLSQVINEIFGKSFTDFINYFRIEEVKKLFKSEKENRYSILDIAFYCGFNSKSGFNRAFKRHMEITPKKFRERKIKG